MGLSAMSYSAYTAPAAAAASSSTPYMEPSFSASLHTSAAVAAAASAQVINLSIKLLQRLGYLQLGLVSYILRDVAKSS